MPGNFLACLPSKAVGTSFALCASADVICGFNCFCMLSREEQKYICNLTTFYTNREKCGRATDIKNVLFYVFE